ncbi:alpha/beta hydrolase [Shouchella patagoniensis]|uniref:alpha/beta hydrolase n=1 Tax=Shouchella patagoniensis TaxID=228576 RepID=UPI0009956AA3|nr:alpha/beta hydrolase [Shouchella patagoniensis]
MKHNWSLLVRISMSGLLVLVLVSLLSIFFVQSLRYTEAGKVPPKTAVMLHAVNKQLLPEGLKTPSFLASKAPPTIQQLEMIMDTKDGDTIPIRVYKPVADGPHPVIVYFHGGAFMEGFGNIETHDNIIRSLAARTKAIVVAPGYRLAPEHVFPTAVNDNYETLEWVVESSEQLDADVERIAVAGDSAGGNLAAAVALKTKQLDGPKIESMALLYPLTTFEDIELNSRDRYSSGYYFLSRSVMERAREVYTPNKMDWHSPYSSPLLAEDLSDLPDTLVITGEFDPLRDEGEAFAHRLHEAGVYTEAVRFNGVMHGFISFYEVMGRGEEGMQLVSDFMRRASSDNALTTDEAQMFKVNIRQEQDTWRDEVEAYIMGVYLISRHIQSWFS